MNEDDQPGVIVNAMLLVHNITQTGPLLNLMGISQILPCYANPQPLTFAYFVSIAPDNIEPIVARVSFRDPLSIELRSSGDVDIPKQLDIGAGWSIATGISTIHATVMHPGAYSAVLTINGTVKHVLKIGAFYPTQNIQEVRFQRPPPSPID